MRPQPTVYGKLIPEISDKILDVFNWAITSRARNYFIRFDLSFPADGAIRNESQLFGDFMRTLIQYENRNLCGDVFYCAAVERESSKNSHYHVFLLYNGHKTQNLYAHMQKAIELWGLILDLPGPALGLIHYRTKDNGIMIRRDWANYENQLALAIFQALYLAKSATKETILMGRRRRFSSTKGIPHRSLDWPFPFLMDLPLIPRAQKRPEAVIMEEPSFDFFPSSESSAGDDQPAAF